MKFITSLDNQVYRSLIDCLQSRGIKKNQQFILAGERATLETLTRSPLMVRDVVVQASDKAEATLQLQAFKDLIPDQAIILALPKELFEPLDIHGTRKPLLVVRTPEIPVANLDLITNGLEIFCTLGDPSNVGALLRSAAAFGASRIVLLKESASPFHPKATRAASGATMITPFATGPSIMELAKLKRQKDAPWVALDMRGTSIAAHKWTKNARLIIGQEGQGVPDSTEFDYLKIEMQNSVESLNATVACSIALYTWSLNSKT